MDDKDKYKLLVLLQTPSNDRRSNAFYPGHDSSSTPPLQDMTSSFCTVSNLKSSIVYLAQELQNLGFRYKIVEANEEKLNLVALVNACWDVIQLYHSAIKDGNILHDSRRRDVADINHLQGSVRELKSVVEEKGRLLLESQEKERQTNSINKALAAKLKAEKDDVKRLNSVLQQRELQHQHETRKKEIEMNKLQDRLHRLVTNEKGTESRMPTITMTASLNRSDRARGRWRTDNTSVKQEEELFRRVLQQYETWVGQLTEETDLLKEFVSTVSGKVSKVAFKFANSQLSSMAREEEGLNDSLACSVLSADSLDDDPLFSVNFISSKDKIQKMIDDNLQIISQSLEIKGNRRRKSSVGVDKDEYQRRSQSQDLDSSVERNIDEVVEGLCVEKVSEIQDQMKQILEIKKKLQHEREVFAAAAVRLNRERANFEAEKVELLRHQFLEELPSSLLSNSGTPFTPNTSLESPVSGSLTDLYGDSPHCIPAVPILTSPTGNITHTAQPVTLGPTRLTRSHREGRIKTSRGGGGLSDPSTRTSSVNRTTETRFLHEVSRAKTLERPTRSACPTPFSHDTEEGVCYSTRSLSRPGKRKQHHLTTLANANFSHSINCPPLEARERLVTTPSTSIISPREVAPRVPLAQIGNSSTEENLSYDSGFCHDHDDTDSSQSYTYHQLRNVQTNTRLNALENSLMNLLDQINSKERLSSTCPPGGLPFPTKMKVEGDSAEVIKDDSSGNLLARTRSVDILPNKPSRSFSSDSQNRDSGALTNTPTRIPVYQAQLPDNERRSAVRQSSAPASASASRKSSCDRKTGEYYLKKIQNNFAKWYWK